MEILVKPVIGILTLPIDENIDSRAQSQYFLDTNTRFLEVSGEVVCVPLRFDLSQQPEMLQRTLDNLDGVLFTGGGLSIRNLEAMPPATLDFYNTAKQTVKYCVNNKLPLLGICQGFEVMLQAVVDLYEPIPDEYQGLAENYRRIVRDSILSDCKVNGKLRTTNWLVDHAEQSSFLSSLPGDFLYLMSKERF
jgi:gamma-glutamyl-gamma-aminobutyrate hydrolase PuuD